MVNEYNKDSCFVGVLLPDIDTCSTGTAARRATLRAISNSLYEGSVNQ